MKKLPVPFAELAAVSVLVKFGLSTTGSAAAGAEAKPTARATATPAENAFCRSTVIAFL